MAAMRASSASMTARIRLVRWTSACTTSHTSSSSAGDALQVGIRTRETAGQGTDADSQPHGLQEHQGVVGAQDDARVAHKLATKRAGAPMADARVVADDVMPGKSAAARGPAVRRQILRSKQLTIDHLDETGRLVREPARAGIVPGQYGGVKMSQATVWYPDFSAISSSSCR